jgi:NAD(P)-dependent dehydrogenase (short-subunit alcohol dehydrogenase family)
MGRLNDRVVIITGAGRGIGYTTAQLFIEEGAKLVLNDLHEERGQKATDEMLEKGGEAIFVHGDVAFSWDWQKIVDAAMNAYSKIDVLFNNAGMSSFKSLDTSEQEWDRVLSVNLKSVFLGCKYVVPIMKEQGYGNIINNASEIGVVGARNTLAYGAAKGGVIQMTKGLALDLATTGIRVNCLSPGITATPLLLDSIKNHPNPEERRNFLVGTIPIHRMADPMEQAKAALFLASDDSSFMTGANLIVDGGWTAQ